MIFDCNGQWTLNSWALFAWPPVLSGLAARTPCPNKPRFRRRLTQTHVHTSTSQHSISKTVAAEARTIRSLERMASCMQDVNFHISSYLLQPCRKPQLTTSGSSPPLVRPSRRPSACQDRGRVTGARMPLGTRTPGSIAPAQCMRLSRRQSPAMTSKDCKLRCKVFSRHCGLC